MKAYQPGLHLIATLATKSIDKITVFEPCQQQLNKLIQTYDLKNLGSVYHNFQPNGFTAIICLSESHISIHTWPDYDKVNLDIYLSNFNRTNNKTVIGIFEDLVHFFDAIITHEQRIER